MTRDEVAWSVRTTMKGVNGLLYDLAVVLEQADAPYSVICKVEQLDTLARDALTEVEQSAEMIEDDELVARADYENDRNREQA